MDDTVEHLDRLVQAYRDGDRAAFRDLVELTELELRSFVATFAPSVDVVEEVVQMSYVIAFQRINHYELRGTFLAWLKGIARNRLRTELDRRRRLLHADHDDLERWMLDQGRGALAEADDEASERREVDLRRLARCIEALPDRSRAIIEQRYQRRLPIADLARNFKKTKAAMAKVVQRLVHGLRRCMAEEEFRGEAS